MVPGARKCGMSPHPPRAVRSVADLSKPQAFKVYLFTMYSLSPRSCAIEGRARGGSSCWGNILAGGAAGRLHGLARVAWCGLAWGKGEGEGDTRVDPHICTVHALHAKGTCVVGRGARGA